MKLKHIALKIQVEVPDTVNRSYGLFVESFSPFSYGVTTTDISLTTALAGLQDAILLSLEDVPLTQEQIDLIYNNINTTIPEICEVHGYDVFVEDDVIIPSLSDELIQKSKSAFNRRLVDLKHQLTKQYIHDNALDLNL